MGGLYDHENPFFGTNLTPRKILEDLGLNLSSAISLSTSYISFDVNPEELKRIINNGIEKSERILLRFEPEVVWPKNYNNQFLDYFGRVISFGCTPSRGDEIEYWPQFWSCSSDYLSYSSIRLDKAVMINSNKISLYTGELYSLRKRAILEVQDLDLYGNNWSHSLFINVIEWLKAAKFTISNGRFPKLKTFLTFIKVPNNFLGTLDDKAAKMADYKFSLVIENSIEVVTEKIFDSFIAGTFPIYVGPDISALGVPSNLYLSSQPNISSIHKSLTRARLVDLETWRLQVIDWLGDEQTIKNWNYLSIFRRFIDTLDTN